jgi:glycerol kinase
MKKYIIALDQGTTSSRAIIFDREQNILGVAQKEFTQYYPQPGWVEHNAMEIYSSLVSVMAEVVAQTDVSVEEIAGIGITNQRETTVVWDRETGTPVCNAIVWQCRRTAELCEEIKKDRELTEYIRKNTGLLVDAYFSATKIRWILDNVPEAGELARQGRLLFGTVDSWLVWKLTGGRVHVTDYTNASRTMLFNIHTLQWDERICRALDIPMDMLPQVRSSSEIYGTTEIQGGSVPICGIAGDQQASLFGQACFEKGQAKNTYGTGCFLLMNTGEECVESRNGLVSTIAATSDGKVRYALEGSVFVGGAVIQWIRDELGLISEAGDSEYFAKKVKDTGGVYLVPAFTGLGAPYWDMYARGTIVGLTRGSRREHIIRAALESIAFQTADLMHAMEKDMGSELKELRTDGGASRNNFLMQFQADVLDMNIYRSAIGETTALGAAYLAGLAVGIWKDIDELRHVWTADRVFSPEISADTRETILSGWHRAIGRSTKWVEEG